jgi:hypothetical protein
LPKTVNGQNEPSLADRISVPFGFAARPFGVRNAAPRHYGDRVRDGIGVQVGATVEHVRTSDDSHTTGGLHLAASLDLPIWGSPGEGGVALRLYGRLLVTPSVVLEANQAVYEPPVSGQIYGGIVFYP